jgi:hypothetical protein
MSSLFTNVMRSRVRTRKRRTKAGRPARADTCSLAREKAARSRSSVKGFSR